MRKALLAISLIGCMGFGHGGGAPCASDQFVAAVLGPGPDVWYGLHEGSGTSMIDRSGNNRNGTYTGSPTLTASAIVSSKGTCDIPNYQCLTTASGKYGSTTNASWMNSAALTLVCWMRISSLAGDAFLCGAFNENPPGTFTSGYGIAISSNHNFPTFYFVLGGTYSTIDSGSTVVVDGARHMIVEQIASGIFTGWVDGVSLSPVTYGGSIDSTNAPFTVGVIGVSLTRPYTGSISDVYRYSYTITGAQIQAQWNAGK